MPAFEEPPGLTFPRSSIEPFIATQHQNPCLSACRAQARLAPSSVMHVDGSDRAADNRETLPISNDGLMFHERGPGSGNNKQGDIHEWLVR